MQVNYAPEGQGRTKYLVVPGKLKSEGQITLKTYTKPFDCHTQCLENSSSMRRKAVQSRKNNSSQTKKATNVEMSC